MKVNVNNQINESHFLSFAETMIESSGSASAWVDLHSNILLFNSKFNEFAKAHFGFEFKLNDPFLPRLPKELQSIFETKLKSVLDEKFVLSIDGSTTNIKILNVRNDENEIFGSLIKLSEQTDQSATDSSEIVTLLTEQKNIYEKILNSIPSEIVVVDLEHRFKFANPAAIKDSEIRNWVIGRTHFEYAEYRKRDPEIAKKRVEMEKSVIAEKKQVEWEETFTSPDGVETRYLRRMSPLFDDNGNLSMLIGYGLDITERKKQEIEFQEQSRFVKKILNSSPNLIYVLDDSGDTIFVNQATAEFNGKTIEELVSRNISEINPDKMQVENILKINRQIIETMKGTDYEEQFTKPDGVTVWLHTIKRPLYRMDGSIHILGTSIDITQRKIAENQIIEKEQLLQSIFDTVQIGISMTDEEGVFYDVNRKFCEIYSYNYEEFIGKQFTFLFPEEVRAERLDYHRNFIAGKGEIPPDAVVLRKDGSKIFATTSSAILVMNNGRKYRLTSVMDITSRKKIEEELIISKEKAEQATIAKSQFLSIMSHEIRTPMNAVIGLAHLLLQENLSDDQKENLKTLKSSADNLLTLINDILDYNRIESGEVELSKLDFNLKELVNGISQSHSILAKEKNIKLTLTIDSELPDYIVGDPSRLSQILANLVANGIKFTEWGHVTVEVLQKTKTKQSIVIEFIISDTGIGISKEKLDHIFERFTQESSDSTRKYGGTGLGLAISKKLIELHGSSINIESKIGVGSKFNFSIEFQLPVSKKSDSDLNLFSPEHRLEGVRVLLVEDNEINQLVVNKFLKKWHVNSDLAVNGKLAIEKIEQNDYELILMDLQMPVMDGYEATVEIRKMADKKALIPIIALTASAVSEVKDRVIQSGMDDFISKPFTPDELFKKIAFFAGR